MSGPMYDTPRSCCPYCGIEHECATNMYEDTGPRAGDVTVCLNCTNLGVFDLLGGIRKPTTGEMLVFNADPKIHRVVNLLRVHKQLGSQA